MAEMARPHGFLVVMSSHRINHFLMVDPSPRGDVWFWHVPALIFGMLGVLLTPALAERARATAATPPPPTPDAADAGGSGGDAAVVVGRSVVVAPRPPRR